MTNEHITKAKHLIVDLFDCKCKTSIINEITFTINAVFESIKLSNNTIIKVLQHKFKPQGISIVVMLAESHLSVHTYPEHKFVSIDIYSCGKHATPEKAVEYLIKTFEPTMYKLSNITRGVKKTKQHSIKSEHYEIEYFDYVVNAIETEDKDGNISLEEEIVRSIKYNLR